jgi:isochorismate synthase
VKESELLNLLLESTKTCNLSVAGFSLPGEKNFTFWVQDTDSDLPHLDNKVFSIHPFYTAEHFPNIHIQPQWCFHNEAEFPELLKSKLLNTKCKQTEYWTSLIGEMPKPTNKKVFLAQVNEIKQQISQGEIEKAMLSAIRIMPKSPKKITDILHDLRINYPNAFISYTSTPFHGTWIGATPEILLFQYGKELETISLAGTKTIDQQHEWGDKEKHEQELVTTYIKELLQTYPVDNIQIEGPEYYVVGQLVHLRTRFQITMLQIPDKSLIFKLANDMHPTPAVGGYPKVDSLKLIKQLEEHERSYYAGFLGPVTEDSARLFVNLRCASLFKNEVVFYSGAGITAGSDPEAEWDETGYKAASVSQYF